MWIHANTRMPYHADQDYRDSVVFSVKQRFGDVPIDVTFLSSWGFLEVDILREDMPALAALPLIERVYESADREIYRGPRDVV